MFSVASLPCVALPQDTESGFLAGAGLSVVVVTNSVQEPGLSKAYVAAVAGNAVRNVLVTDFT